MDTDKKDKKNIEMLYPRKGMYMIEILEYSWEFDHANDLENDPMVIKWTKKHGIRIPYIYEGKKHYYIPDFLVELINGDIEIHEVKSKRDLENPLEQVKFNIGKRWCEEHRKYNKQNITYKIITRDI